MYILKFGNFSKTWSLAPHTCTSLTCFAMKSQRQKEGILNSDQDFMSYIVLKLLSVF